MGEFRWRTFAAALVILTAVMAAAWSSVCPPFYLTNDDVTMRMAFEGRSAPGAAPTGFALMTNAVLGWAIVAAQRIAPSLPGWDVVLAAALVWALAVLVALLWDALGTGWLARATVAAALLLAIAPAIASVQFTISATLAGGAAALLAVVELGRPQPRKAVLGMAVVLYLAGLLIRPMGGPAGAAVAAGLTVPVLRTRRRWWVQLLGIGAIVVVLFVAAQYVDALLYGMRSDWDAYFRFNWIVGPLLEWGTDVASSSANDIRQAVGWTANDWLMLVGSWGVDPVIHGFTRVSQAYAVQTAALAKIGTVSLMLSRAGSYSAASVSNLIDSSMLVALGSALLLAAYATRRAAAEGVAVLVLFLATCFLLDLTFERLPWRLLAPLQILFVSVTLLTIGSSRRVAAPMLGILSLGAMLAITAPVLQAEAREAQSRVAESRELDGEVAALQRQLSPSLVILYGSRFPREHWWRPFHHPSIDLPGVALGWNNQNPQVQQYLSRTGRQPLLRALCTDPSILVIADREPLDLVGTYMREHFNTAVEWTKVYDGSFPAWRCSAIRTASTAAASHP